MESRYCGECRLTMLGTFCTKCGRATTQLRKECPHCGAEMYVWDKFCGECGNDMQGEEVRE